MMMIVPSATIRTLRMNRCCTLSKVFNLSERLRSYAIGEWACRSGIFQFRTQYFKRTSGSVADCRRGDHLHNCIEVSCFAAGGSDAFAFDAQLSPAAGSRCNLDLYRTFQQRHRYGRAKGRLRNGDRHLHVQIEPLAAKIRMLPDVDREDEVAACAAQ